MDSKTIIENQLKKKGKALYEQSIRVSKTYAAEVSKNIVGNGRKSILFEQIAQMQAYIEILKVGEGITDNEISARVCEILGVPQEKEEKTQKKTTPPKRVQPKKKTSTKKVNTNGINN